jgi:hypothetical protein
MTDICPVCGEILQLGEWPFCGGKNHHGSASHFNVIDDAITGGARHFENLGHTPVYIESKSQLKAELKARGLEPHVRHVGVPGSDKSPNTTRWT